MLNAVKSALGGKRFFAVFVALSFLFGLGQAEWVSVGQGASKSGFEILNTKGNETIIEIRVNGFNLETQTIGGENFHTIALPNAGFTSQIGIPQMPVMGTLFAIQKGARIEVEITKVESTLISDLKIMPAQLKTDCDFSTTKNFVIKRDFYLKNQNFPGQLAIVSQPKVWRDLDIVELKVSPMQYNPSKSEVKVYTKMIVKIKQIGGQKVNKTISARYAKLYKPLVLNYQYLGYKEANIPGRYLIICADTFLTDIQPLAQWYYRKGYSAQVVPVSQIGSTVDEIKNFILNQYQTKGLDWALLVGNVNQIPWYIDQEGAMSDSWYSFLIGADVYPEIAVGRLSIRGDVSLNNQIQKIVAYQKSPFLGDWLTKSLLVAHKEQYPYKYSSCVRDIFQYNYQFFKPTMDTLMGGCGASNADVTAALNEGRNIVSYRGHGSNYKWWEWGSSGSWTNDNIDGLANGAMTPIIYNIACNCHRLDCVGTYPICIGEKWLAKENGGAVASLGASRPSYTIPNHDYNKGLYYGPFDHQIFEIGWVSNFSSAYILPMHGDLAVWNAKIYGWLGDPALEIWTRVPQQNELAVEHPEKVVDNEDFIVRVRISGRPVPQALVCLVKGNEVYEVGYTNPAGQINFQPTFQVTTDSAHLTVTVHNYLPYEVTLSTTAVGESEENSGLGKKISLTVVNPVAGKTVIKYFLAAKDLIKLAVYDIAGREVITLTEGERTAGEYTVCWNPENLGSRIYFICLKTEKLFLSQKIVLIK